MESLRSVLMKCCVPTALSDVLAAIALILTLMYMYILKPLQARACKVLVVRNVSVQDSALVKYHELLHEEQWEAALDEYFRSSLSLPLTDEWKIRVGLAFCDIKDKKKLNDVFNLAKRLLADLHCQSSRQPENYLKTLYELIQTRTRYFVPSKPSNGPLDDYIPDFGLVEIDFLVHLFALYAEFIGLCNQTRHYPDGPRQEFPRIAATIIQKEKGNECAKDWINLLLQSDSHEIFFGQDLVDQWKMILGDGDPTKAEQIVLGQCMHWVQEEHWEKAVTQYKIYSRLTISNTATRDPGLIYKIYVGLALKNIEDGERVDQVLKLARVVVFVSHSMGEREQCIEQLYDVFQARVHFLMKFKKKGKVFDWSHLAEIPFLSKSFLEVCESSNLGGMYYEYNRNRLVALLTPVVEVVKVSEDADVISNRFVKDMEPYTEDLYL